MAEVKDLMKHYHLSEEDCAQQISDIHIDEIALSYCGKWRSLPPYLKLERIVADDIDRGPGSERDKRRTFLQTWKDAQGSGATYAVLISALLKIRCRNDAEGVCNLMKKDLSLSTRSRGTL